MSLQRPYRGNELLRITPLTASLACQAPPGSPEWLNPNHIHQTPSLEEKQWEIYSGKRQNYLHF